MNPCVSKFRLPRVAAPLFACLTLWSATTFAAPDDGSTQWGLGAVATTRQRPYAGDDRQTRFLPLVFVNNRWVRVAGEGIALKLPSAGAFSFDLRAAYVSDGYKSGNAPILDGMADRKAGVWLGAGTTWHDSLADVSFEWLADVSGHGDGQSAKLGIEHAFRMGRFELKPHVALKWLSAKDVDYYYGVRANEVTADRPEYHGKSTFDPELGLHAGYLLTPQQSVFLDAGTTWLGSHITDSPLVGRTTTTGVAIGYLYRF